MQGKKAHFLSQKHPKDVPKTSQRPHNNLLKNFKINPKDHQKISQKPHKDLPKTTQRPPKDFSKASQRPSKDLQKTSQRPPKDLPKTCQSFPKYLPNTNLVKFLAGVWHNQYGCIQSVGEKHQVQTLLWSMFDVDFEVQVAENKYCLEFMILY